MCFFVFFIFYLTFIEFCTFLKFIFISKAVLLFVTEIYIFQIIETVNFYNFIIGNNFIYDIIRPFKSHFFFVFWKFFARLFNLKAVLGISPSVLAVISLSLANKHLFETLFLLNTFCFMLPWWKIILRHLRTGCSPCPPHKYNILEFCYFSSSLNFQTISIVWHS